MKRDARTHTGLSFFTKRKKAPFHTLTCTRVVEVLCVVFFFSVC